MTAIDRSVVYRGTHEAIIVTILVPRVTGHARVALTRERVIKGVPDRVYEFGFTIDERGVLNSLKDDLRLALEALEKAAASL